MADTADLVAVFGSRRLSIVDAFVPENAVFPRLRNHQIVWTTGCPTPGELHAAGTVRDWSIPRPCIPRLVSIVFKMEPWVMLTKLVSTKLPV